MNASTQHRGPDFSNTKMFDTPNGRFYLGSNRLKIIDRHDASNQPFQKTGSSWILLFNGFISNYLELREDLKAKFDFVTSSDTEVLYAYLLVNGIASLQDLNGMFAFVWLNGQTGEFFIVRDRGGIKPLYYYFDKDCLLASSELRSLQNVISEKRINTEGLKSYFVSKYTEIPDTVFKGFQTLPLGSQIDQTEKVTNCLKEQADNKVLYDYEVLKRKLLKAIKRNIQADVEVGLLLSGGVDSSLLLAYLSELGVQKIHTFSIGYEKEMHASATNDLYYSRKVAEKFNTIHHEIILSEFPIDIWDEYIQSTDAPVGDSAGILTYIITKKARKYCKVLLSGAGADELFAGYHRHWAFQQYLHKHSFLPFLNILKMGLNGLRNVGFKKGVQLEKFLRGIDQNRSRTYNNFHRLKFDLQRTIRNVDNLEDALLDDLMNYLPQDILILSDQYSMANGVELRVPFLDHDLRNYALSLSGEEKLKKGKKWMLKELLAQKIDKEIVYRRKEGFGMPLREWFRQEGHFLNERFKTVAPFISTYFKEVDVFKMQKEHLAGKADYSQELYTVVLMGEYLKRR